MQTFPTLMFGHVADAAFVRGCSGVFFAVQRGSPKQPFKLVTHTGFQTDLPPHGAGTHMSRDEAHLGKGPGNGRFLWLPVSQQRTNGENGHCFGRKMLAFDLLRLSRTTTAKTLG